MMNIGYFIVTRKVTTQALLQLLAKTDRGCKTSCMMGTDSSDRYCFIQITYCNIQTVP